MWTPRQAKSGGLGVRANKDMMMGLQRQWPCEPICHWGNREHRRNQAVDTTSQALYGAHPSRPVVWCGLGKGFSQTTQTLVSP